MMEKFEILPQSWYKRRKPTDTPPQITAFEVIDFVKQDNHRCQISVSYDNGETLLLAARVYVNRTHEIQSDGTLISKDNSWGVQGTNEHGTSVVLRLIVA